MNNNTDYQVIIVGAGMVGAALAVALGRAGFRVALLDRHAPPVYETGGEYGLRVSALSMASRNVLMNLGVWNYIAATRVSPYREMYVWESDDNGGEAGKADIHFDCVDVQQECLGYIVENDLVQSTLIEQLEGLPDVDTFFAAGLENMEFTERCVIAWLSDGRRLAGQLLIGVDGANSRVRQLAGIRAQTHSYRQQGVVAVVGTELSHRATAWQRFLPTGPLAFLPLADGRCSIVWSTGEARANELLSLEEAAFCKALGEASEYKLGEIISPGPRAAFPLQYLQAGQYTLPRLALAGDAAHVVHPLAGQGVNLGFRDAAKLVEQLQVAHYRRQDLGAVKHLRRYERSRKADNRPMGLALDGLKYLFAAQSIPAVAARRFGLRTVDNFQPLKSFFMRQAMGLDGELPELAVFPENF
ncbi:MAG TPA: UbiH/UbiF/VisC/COQ6 family ubiquinone biosynthesis hydroxylase [Gammaproteobacteria bacterium]